MPRMSPTQEYTPEMIQTVTGQNTPTLAQDRVPTTTYTPPPQPQQEPVAEMAFGELGELGLTKQEEEKLANVIKRLYPRASAKQRYNMALQYIKQNMPEDMTEDNMITNDMVDQGLLPEEQREIYPQQAETTLTGKRKEEDTGGDGADLKQRLSPERMASLTQKTPEDVPLPVGGSLRSLGGKTAVVAQQAGSQKEKRGFLDNVLNVAGNLVPTTAINTLAGDNLNIPNVNPIFQYKTDDNGWQITGKALANLPGSALNVGVDITNALALNADDTLMGLKAIVEGMVDKARGKETEETEILNSIRDELSGPYKDLFDGGDMDQFLEFLVENPAVVLSDVVGVLAAGSGVAAKGAMLTGKVAKSSKLAKAASSLQKANKVLDLVDPAYHATKGVTTLGLRSTALAGKGLKLARKGVEKGVEVAGDIKSGVTKEAIEASVAGESNVAQARRVSPEFLDESKQAIEAYSKDAGKNPDPLMRGGQKIEEAVKGAVTKPMERVGEQIGEIRKAVADLPIDSTAAKDELVKLLEEKYNAKIAEDGSLVPAKGTKLGLPEAGAEADIVKGLLEDLDSLADGGVGGDIERIFADMNKKYKAIDALSDKGALYDPLLKADLYNIRELLYEALDEHIDSAEFARLKKEYGSLSDSQRRLERLYQKAGKGPSGERLPTNTMLKKLFSTNPEEAKVFLEELSKVTGEDWVAKINTLGTVAADMVEPNLFEQIFDLRPSQVVGGSRFFKNDLVDKILKWGAKKIVGSPTEILESYIGKDLDTLPKSVQTQGFDDISKILEDANKMYSEGAEQADVVDFISDEMDKTFDQLLDEANKGESFNKAGAAESAEDIAGQKAMEAEIAKSMKGNDLVSGTLRSQIAFLEGQNNTGRIKSLSYMKQKDQIIERIMGETNLDQFEAAEMYEQLASKF